MAGADHRPDLVVEGHQAGPVPQAGGHGGQHHHCVHRVLQTGDVADLARHDPPVVEQDDHRLVPLGPEGPHDRTVDPGTGRPVDAPELVVHAVVPQLVELGASAPARGGPQTDLEQSGLVDAQLGLLLGAERGMHPQDPGQVPGGLPGDEAQGTGDPDGHLAGLEAAPPGRPEGGRGPDLLARGQLDPHPPVIGPQGGGELVGHQDPGPPPGATAHPPGDLGFGAQGHDAGQVPGHLDAAGRGREGQVDEGDQQHGPVDHQQGDHPVVAQGEHDDRGDGQHGRQPSGGDGHGGRASGGPGRWPGCSGARRRP